MTTLLVGFDEDTGAGCGVTEAALMVREAGWASLDALVDGTKADAIDLPAGAASRSDVVEHVGRLGTRDIYTEGGKWFFLGCYAVDPPEDRWLSVAETFGFLPAEE